MQLLYCATALVLELCQLLLQVSLHVKVENNVGSSMHLLSAAQPELHGWPTVTAPSCGTAQHRVAEHDFVDLPAMACQAPEHVFNVLCTAACHLLEPLGHAMQPCEHQSAHSRFAAAEGPRPACTDHPP